MPVFRINKNDNYTVMSNYHLKDTNLTLRAKGLLSLMLSLPDNWNYSKKGLIAICKEGRDTLESTLDELKKNNYLFINQERVDGKFDYVYLIYETPYTGKPCTVKPNTVNQHQLNTNIENTKEIKEIDNNLLLSKRKFEKPTLEEIEEYCKSRNNNVNAKEFYEYYDVANWKDSNGKQIKNWKQKLIYWENRDKKKANYQPRLSYQERKQKEQDEMWERIFEEERQEKLNASNGS